MNKPDDKSLLKIVYEGPDGYKHAVRYEWTLEVPDEEIMYAWFQKSESEQKHTDLKEGCAYATILNIAMSYARLYGVASPDPANIHITFPDFVTSMLT
jgi:hypothetical protein